MKKETAKENIEELEKVMQEEIDEAITEKVDETAELIVALQNQIKELENKNVRSQAEMINFRRRKDEETIRLMKYANEDLIMDIINIVDNFERAIKLDDRDLSDELSKFLEGFKMIYTTFVEILNKYEVKEIICDHIEFDPNYHQAVLIDNDPNIEPNMILEVLQKGYMYKDKVIRPAKVKVNQ